MSVVTLERTGTLVRHGDDLYGRPDAVEFTARAGAPTIDWLVEATVIVDHWATRCGIATLFEAVPLTPDDDAGRWQPLADAMPFDALYVTRRMPVRLVFSQFVRLQPGAPYRLALPGAVVASGTLTLAVQVRSALLPHAIINRYRARRGVRR